MRKKEKKNKRNLKATIFIATILLSIVIGIGIARIVFYSFCVYKIIDYDMYLIVDKNIGFDLNKSYVHFGKVTPGGSSIRKLNLINNLNNNVKAKLEVSGNFTNWIYIQQNHYTLKPKENKTITLTVKVPKNATYGNYSGKLRVIFSRC